MRDVPNFEDVTPSFQGRPPARKWEDTQGMTQQGFKRFRRKKGANSASTEIHVTRTGDASMVKKSKAPVTGSSLVVHSGAPRNLPVTLPETWDRLRRVMPGTHKQTLEELPLVSFHREDPATKAFDLLRTRVLNAIKAKGWKRIAVAAPTRGCGATFTAVNLALSLARVPNSRNILLDLNHRNPGVADMLDLAGFGDMPGFLGGRVSLERHLIRTGETLALGLTSYPDRDAAEILHDSHCADTLDHMCDELDPDVVIMDLPPVLEYDDLVAIAPRVDAVLLVSDGTQTSPRQLDACEKVLENQARILGVVLNRARASDSMHAVG